MMEEFLIDIGYFETHEGLWMHKDAKSPLPLKDAYNYELEQFGVVA